ncbi:MAG: hypothetical protein M3R51_03200 [Candidatus Eremiobacteraeota bacterium]|nr:hypothetical protein [Candidatus Eremiobacteraeota bacterium]
MQDVSPKWLKSGVVLVCERCFKERIPEETPEVAARIGDFNLRDWLKAELKEHGEWGPVRVISTSCMDVCAKGKVTVAIDSQTVENSAKVLIVDPLEDKEELYDKIVDELGRKN